jgi:hypothetical protein
MNIHTVLFPSRPHADTLLAFFLLKRFGQDIYPGISSAKAAFSSHLPADATQEKLMMEGTLLLDSGGGDLDHHERGQTTTLSELILKKLGMTGDPAFEKIITFVRRDDLYGKGIVSTDPIDRAFGLSGIITMLNKAYGHDHVRIVDAVLPIIEAYYIEENRRTKEMPAEVEEKQKSGKAESFTVRQRDKNLKVIVMESDNPSLTGYLRSQLGGAYDVVALWSSTGHLNIMTRPTKKVDLRSLVALIRAEEIRGKGGERPIDELAQAGKIADVPEWYYDQKTNSMQNGAMAREGVPPTKIDRITARKLLELGLSEALWSPARI